MSEPWYLRPLTVFDLESTGVNVREDRIVTGYVGTLWPASAGAGSTTGAKVMINPGVEIPAAASAVHGISTERAIAEGCDPRDGVNSLAEALAQSLRTGHPVVGFNLAYDLSMLHWECARHRVATVAQRLGCAPDGIAPMVDSHVLDMHVEPYRPGRRNLLATCTRWGVRHDGAHDGEFDAKAAARIAFMIAQAFPREIGMVPVNILHDQQIAWRRAQAVSRQAYFRSARGGRPDAVVDPCWPLCVNPTHRNT